MDNVQNGILIPAIPDSQWVNSDHIPFYREHTSKYSWGKTNSGNRQIGTGGTEKERFTAQLTIKKDGSKLPVFFIFKGALAPENGRLRSNTVMHELIHREADSNGNEYPPEDKAVLVCTPTANSNGNLTIDILKKVIFPAIGIDYGSRGGVLVDDFKGHSKDIVKDFTTSKKSGCDELPNDERYNLCEFQIMDGGITPCAQPIDAFIGKLVKGNYCESYDAYSLSAAINEKTGHPKPPSRQLCAQWVVDGFYKIPSELIRKAWTICGYQSKEDVDKEENNIGTVYRFSESDAIQTLVMAAGGSDYGEAIARYLKDPEYDVGTNNFIGDDDDNLDLEDDEGTWVQDS